MADVVPPASELSSPAAPPPSGGAGPGGGDEPAPRGRRQALAGLGSLAASCALAPACAPWPRAPARRSRPGGGADELALVGATVFAAPGAPPIVDGVVLARGGRIVAVGARDDTPPISGRALDVRGAFVTAGFWNCHVHFTGPPWAGAATRPAAALGASLRATFGRYGFTTVVDLGSPFENTDALRGRVRRGEVAGPEVLAAVESFFPPGGTPAYLRRRFELAGEAPPELRTVAEAEAAVRACAARGADVIKLFTGSPVGGGRTAHMPDEIVRAACAEARRAGKVVFAHPQDEDGVRLALEGGVDVLAHTAPAAGPLPPELLARARRARMAVVPTLALWHRGLMAEGLPEADALDRQRRGVEQLRGLVAAGVEVLFGTDVGYFDGADPAEELRAMASAGMGFDRLLDALTAAPARRLGRADRSGRVAVGHDADLVVLAADPRADAAALGAVRLSVRGGRVLYDAARA